MHLTLRFINGINCDFLRNENNKEMKLFESSNNAPSLLTHTLTRIYIYIYIERERERERERQRQRDREREIQGDQRKCYLFQLLN